MSESYSPLRHTFSKTIIPILYTRLGLICCLWFYIHVGISFTLICVHILMLSHPLTNEMWPTFSPDSEVTSYEPYMNLAVITWGLSSNTITSFPRWFGCKFWQGNKFFYYLITVSSPLTLNIVLSPTVVNDYPRTDKKLYDCTIFLWAYDVHYKLFSYGKILIL